MPDIILSNGQRVLVDDQDWPRLSRYPWFPSGRNGLYPACSQATMIAAGFSSRQMHRIIMQAPPGKHVDHRNGDTFDNRRANLRWATRQQNAHKRAGHDKTSRYKGVYWRSDKGRWISQVVVGGKAYYGHLRDVEQEAARDADRLMRQRHGAFAYLNFPDEEPGYH